MSGVEVEIHLGQSPYIVYTQCIGECEGGKSRPLVIKGREIYFSIVNKSESDSPVKYIGRLEGSHLKLARNGNLKPNVETLKRLANAKPGHTATLAGAHWRPDGPVPTQFTWGRPDGKYNPNWAAGRDVSNASLYICRAKYKGGLHPAIPNYIAGYNARDEGGPPTENLYVCRVLYGGAIPIGKVLAGKCNFAWGAQERTATSFEVLQLPLPDKPAAPNPNPAVGRN